MSKNIEEIKNRIEKHFGRSKNSILHIGIKKKDEVSKFVLKEDDIDNISLFGLGSVSKTIIATYLNKLVKEGKVDLDKTLDHYLETNEKINYPTILEIATHTSGYHAFIPLFPCIFSLLSKGFNRRNFYTGFTEEWMKNSIRRIKPLRKKKYRYSDYNYAILALLIEHIEQKPYKEVIINFLHKDIGMTNTKYGSLELTKNTKYSWIWEDDNPFLSSGGLFSDVDDMLLFLDYQITHQNELTESHGKYHKMNLNKNIFTGFSWNAFYTGSFYWHIGGQGRFRSYALFDKKRDISIIILATVDKDIQHIGRMGSSLYRNIKRNDKLAKEFLEMFDKTNTTK